MEETAVVCASGNHERFPLLASSVSGTSSHHLVGPFAPAGHMSSCVGPRRQVTAVPGATANASSRRSRSLAVLIPRAMDGPNAAGWPMILVNPEPL